MKLVFSGSLHVSLFIISNPDNYTEVYVPSCSNYRELKPAFYIIAVSNTAEHFLLHFKCQLISRNINMT